MYLRAEKADKQSSLFDWNNMTNKKLNFIFINDAAA